MGALTRSLAATLTMTAAAAAADHHVYPGSSIQDALDAAAAGDRVLVHAGTYHEVLTLGSKQVEVIGLAGASATVIDGQGFDASVVHAAATLPGTRIAGLTLTRGAGTPRPSSYGKDYYGGAVYADNTAQLEVVECVLVDNGWGTGTFGGGLYSGEAGTHVDVRRSVIAFNRAWACGGGILVDHEATLSLEQCTVFGNSSDDFFGHQGGVAMANAGRVWVSHGIVWGNEGLQIEPFGGDYSLGCEAYVDHSDVQGGHVGTGNLDLDPLFADGPAGDFALLPGSPCLDAGAASFPADCDGSPADLGGVLPDCDDCDGDGVPDALELALGSAVDCDGNGMPDGCELGLPGADLDGDGILDICELEVFGVVPAAGPWYAPATLTVTGGPFDLTEPVQLILRSSSTPPEGDPPLAGTVLDAATVIAELPAGHATGAGWQDLVVRQGPAEGVLPAAWRCLPSLELQVSGDVVAGGTVEAHVACEAGGLVYLWHAPATAALPIAVPGVHGALGLDPATLVWSGAGGLLMSPALQWPFAAGVLPAGLTVQVQGLVVELPYEGLCVAFTEVVGLTIP